MSVKRYLIKYFYIGSENYFGSQRQQNNLTIEECIITALKIKDYIKDNRSANLEFESRTDKLVSAKGATFSFLCQKETILMEINNALPWDIGVWACAEVPLNFLSRYNALYRHYKYLLRYDSSAIDIDVLKRACKEFEGTHNLTNFSKIDKEGLLTRRTIDLAEVVVKDKFLIFDFKSKAFLRQQIRRMVKKILEVGEGIITYEDFIALFNSKEYVSYQPAEARGLILWDIIYDNSIDLMIDPRSYERMMKYFSSQELDLSFQVKLFKILQHDNIS